MPVPDSPTTTDRRGDIAGWLFIGAIGVTALFLCFVHAPQRIKLPLLSPLALGAVAGWGLGRWARSRQVAGPRLAMTLSFGLIAAGQVGAAFEAHRIGSRAIQFDLNRHNLELSPLIDQIEQAFLEETEDEAARDRLRTEHESARHRRNADFDRRHRLLTFAGYLESRIPPQWGRWPPPLPEYFWGAEIALSCALGAWLVRRALQAPIA